VEFSSDSELLAVTKQLWEGFCSKMNTLSCMFMYLDRSFVLQATAVRSLRALALQVLRRQLSASPTIGTVYSKLLELISIERGEGTIDRILAKTILQMLMELNMYENGFEKSVLVASAKHYTQDSRKHLEVFISQFLFEYLHRANNFFGIRNWTRPIIFFTLKRGSRKNRCIHLIIIF
jgi:cullin-4